MYVNFTQFIKDPIGKLYFGESYYKRIGLIKLNDENLLCINIGQGIPNYKTISFTYYKDTDTANICNYDPSKIHRLSLFIEYLNKGLLIANEYFERKLSFNDFMAINPKILGLRVKPLKSGRIAQFTHNKFYTKVILGNTVAEMFTNNDFNVSRPDRLRKILEVLNES